ncbi:NCS2 family permease [Marinicella meishanensis]|uniref:NCS2 family permease n=1 Tax=Marinicella meishanensis TaxID=2873263 RepID=UPI001CBF1CC3|nr:NCS2 family permease [Marinicella sp. NBU2979]
MLDRWFKLTVHRTSVKQEILAGISTFLAMAYIMVINPNMLSATGMDAGAVFVATCLAAAIGSALMGLLANYPIALAPGMGLNAFFTFGVVGAMGHSWQVALGCVFWSGVIFFLLSVFKLRQWLINTMPRALKTAIAAGIGLFLAMIALQNAGIIVNNEATLVGLGDFKSAEVLLTFFGFLVIVVLHHHRQHAAIIMGIVLVTTLAWLLDLVPYQGLVAMPPSLSPTWWQLEWGVILDLALWPVIIAFLFVDLFDTSGTLVAVAEQAELLDEDGHLPKADQAMMADSGATMAGALLGTSTTTSYIESGAGVTAGGQTGLTALTVALLFLLSLFLSPLAGMIPPYATAAALLFVAMLMLAALRSVAWDDASEYIPVLLTALIMPFSFSISDGIAVGFIAYALIKALTGQSGQVPISVWVIAVLFTLRFVFLL